MNGVLWYLGVGTIIVSRAATAFVDTRTWRGGFGSHYEFTVNCEWVSFLLLFHRRWNRA